MEGSENKDEDLVNILQKKKVACMPSCSKATTLHQSATCNNMLAHVFESMDLLDFLENKVLQPSRFLKRLGAVDDHSAQQSSLSNDQRKARGDVLEAIFQEVDSQHRHFKHVSFDDIAALVDGGKESRRDGIASDLQKNPFEYEIRENGVVYGAYRYLAESSVVFKRLRT